MEQIPGGNESPELKAESEKFAKDSLELYIKGNGSKEILTTYGSSSEISIKQFPKGTILSAIKEDYKDYHAFFIVGLTSGDTTYIHYIPGYQPETPHIEEYLIGRKLFTIRIVQEPFNVRDFHTRINDFRIIEDEEYIPTITKSISVLSSGTKEKAKVKETKKLNNPERQKWFDRLFGPKTPQTA